MDFSKINTNYFYSLLSKTFLKASKSCAKSEGLTSLCYLCLTEIQAEKLGALLISNILRVEEFVHLLLRFTLRKYC